MRSSSRTHFKISKSDLEDILAWLAGAANNSKNTEEQDALNNLCDAIEAVLS